ncbi:hypothetical protein [Nisaea sp.]|uniref:hypothetical protein n=1 Tax=Nisaea sp. TaxID=2024842 RepID=UPI003266CCDB
MAKWCNVTVSYDPTGYQQKYKRDIRVHDEDLAKAFVTDAKLDSLTRINENLPNGNAPATLDDLGTTSLQVYQGNNPGDSYREI